MSAQQTPEAGLGTIERLQATGGNGIGRSVLVFNPYASSAGRLAVEMNRLQSDPAFQKPTIVYTCVDPSLTIRQVHGALDSDTTQMVVAIGGDETARQVVEALCTARDEHDKPARNKIFGVLHRGNAGNLAANLAGGNPHTNPLDVVQRGILTEIRPGVVAYPSPQGETIEKYFTTIMGLGALSIGAKALNTWMRRLPKFDNPRMRDIYERTILTPYTYLAGSKFSLVIATSLAEPGGQTVAEETSVEICSYDIARARHIGKHGNLPVDITDHQLFAFIMGSRKPREVWEWSQRIQSRTLPGQFFDANKVLRLIPDRPIWANVDGTHFPVGANSRLEARLAETSFLTFMVKPPEQVHDIYLAN